MVARLRQCLAGVDHRGLGVVLHAEILRRDHGRPTISFAGCLGRTPRLRWVLVPIGPLGSGPASDRREYFTKERPNKRQVGDKHRNGRLAEIPIHVDIGDEGGDQAVDFGQDGCDDDEDPHSEYKEKNDLLLERDTDSDNNGDGDEQHENIGGDRYASLDDFVVLVCGTLICDISHEVPIVMGLPINIRLDVGTAQ